MVIELDEPAAKKAKKRDDALPPALAGLTSNDLDCIMCKDVVLTQSYAAFNFFKGQSYKMASYVLLPTETNVAEGTTSGSDAVDLTTLTAAKLRKFAKNLGVKQSSKMSTDVLLLTIAKLSKSEPIRTPQQSKKLIDRKAVYFERIQQAIEAASQAVVKKSKQDLRVAMFSEARQIEGRLASSSLLPEPVKRGMEARLKKVYNELYGEDL